MVDSVPDSTLSHTIRSQSIIWLLAWGNGLLEKRSSFDVSKLLLRYLQTQQSII